jgi:hypothetical protein
MLVTPVLRWTSSTVVSMALWHLRPAPASPGPAPLWSGDVPGQPLAKRPTGDAVYNTPSSALGAPVVTIPLTAVQGMPMGIQLLGQPQSDDICLVCFTRTADFPGAAHPAQKPGPARRGGRMQPGG